MTQRVKMGERRKRQAADLVLVWEYIHVEAKRIAQQPPLQPDDYIFRAVEPGNGDGERKDGNG